MTCRAALAATNKNKKIIKIVVSRYYQRVYVDSRARPAPRPKSLLPKALRQFLRANTVPINQADILRFLYRLSGRFVAKNHKAFRCEISAAYFLTPLLFLLPASLQDAERARVKSAGRLPYNKSGRHTKTNRGKYLLPF
jgi:hypothetical protein